MSNIHQHIGKNKDDCEKRMQTDEDKADERAASDRAEKNDMWTKLCGKNVVQDLADKVGGVEEEMG